MSRSHVTSAGCGGTQAWGINDNGKIVGQCTDAAGNNHGFYAEKH
jgi:hypothetical protein